MGSANTSYWWFKLVANCASQIKASSWMTVCARDGKKWRKYWRSCLTVPNPTTVVPEWCHFLLGLQKRSPLWTLAGTGYCPDPAELALWLLDALPWGSDGRNLLCGQGPEGFRDEVGLPVDHGLPPRSLHHVRGMPAGKEQPQPASTSNSSPLCNIPISKVRYL